MFVLEVEVRQHHSHLFFHRWIYLASPKSCEGDFTPLLVQLLLASQAGWFLSIGQPHPGLAASTAP